MDGWVGGWVHGWVHGWVAGSLERVFGMQACCQQSVLTIDVRALPCPALRPALPLAGAFPLWLAPVQCRLVPVNAAVADYVAGVAASLREAGVRVEVASGAAACMLLLALLLQLRLCV